MRKGKHYRKEPKKVRFNKALLLGAVSLLLVALMAVTSTVSWIEDVSQVEFSSTDGQETPLHIGSKILLSDATMTKDADTVDLNKYFNKSGDMHLSPCFGDGENFYFPVQNGTGYRIGTKDDANVNYLSVTFRVISEGAATAYWFEKTGNTSFVTFKKGDTDVSGSGLEQQLRCSVTVDGVTNVYAFDDGDKTNGYQKKYYTVEAVNGTDTPTEKIGRSVEEFSYYDEQFGADETANNAFANQGADKKKKNLNGNTLFTVNKFDSNHKAETAKTVTFKLWLESRERGETADTAGVDLASLNLNIISGWAKTRRIYVADKTIDQWDAGLNDGQGNYTGAYWLTGDNATLHWAIDGNENNAHYSSKGNIGNIKKQYFEIPNVYNNTACHLYRCSSDGWNHGNDHEGVNYWDAYPTAFPNTFHSETYTVYTKNYGTWETVERHVEFINSCHFTFQNSTQFTQPYAYMWDSSTDTGAADKVVQNKTWPGVEMVKLNKTKSNLEVYAFYYNSNFDRIIFNDNFIPKSAAYQTADINLDNAKENPSFYVGKVYDMATMKWYDSFNSLPSYSDYSVRGEFYTSRDMGDNSRYTISRMVAIPNSNLVYCRIYVRAASSGNELYSFKVVNHVGQESQWTWYGWGQQSSDIKEFNDMTQVGLYAGQNDLGLKATETNSAEYSYKYIKDGEVKTGHRPGIYGFYFDTNSHQLLVRKETLNGPESLPTSLN